MAFFMAVAPITAHSADLLPPESLAGAGLIRYWQVAIPMTPAELLVAVHQVDEYIYAITDKAVVFAIHADTGLIRWVQQVDRPGYTVYAPTHRINAAGNRETVIVSANRMGIYTIEHGDVVAGMRLPFAPSTPGVADTEYVYMGSLNRRMYAYRISDRIRVWQVLTGGPIKSAPQLIGEELFFASRGGSLYVCTARNRMKSWVAKTGTAIQGDIAISNTMVYMAGQDRHVYAYDRQTGNERWQRQLPNPLLSGPLATGDTVYQFADEAGLYALDPDRGSVRWTYPGRLQFLARGDSRLYLVDETGGGHVLDNATGQLEVTFEAAAAELSLPNLMDETLFLANRAGVIACIRPQGASPLKRRERFQRAPARPVVAAQTTSQSEPTITQLPNPFSAILRDPFRSRRTVAPLAGSTQHKP